MFFFLHLYFNFDFCWDWQLWASINVPPRPLNKYAQNHERRRAHSCTGQIPDNIMSITINRRRQLSRLLLSCWGESLLLFLFFKHIIKPAACPVIYRDIFLSQNCLTTSLSMQSCTTGRSDSSRARSLITAVCCKQGRLAGRTKLKMFLVTKKKQNTCSMRNFTKTALNCTLSTLCHSLLIMKSKQK